MVVCQGHALTGRDMFLTSATFQRRPFRPGFRRQNNHDVASDKWHGLLLLDSGYFSADAPELVLPHPNNTYPRMDLIRHVISLCDLRGGSDAENL